MASGQHRVPRPTLEPPFRRSLRALIAAPAGLGAAGAFRGFVLGTVDGLAITLGLLALLGAGLAALVGSDRRKATLFACLAGAVVAACAVAWAGPHLMGRPHLPAFGEASALVGRILGLHAAAVARGGALQTDSEVVRLAPTPLGLGTPLLIGAFVGTLAISFMLGRAPRLAAFFVAVLLTPAALAIHHAVAVVAVGAGSNGFLGKAGAASAMSVVCGAFSLGAFIVLLAPFSLLLLGGSPRPPVVRGTRDASRAALLLVAALAATGGAYLSRVDRVTSIGAGNVLIDDAHVRHWEVAGARFDSTWRGDMSVYACSAAAELLGDSFAVRVHREGPLDADALRHVNVLVLKVPDRDYSPDEVAAIHNFIRSGGGLLAIGDHTDLMGSSTRLNHVLAPTGIRLEPTAVMTWDRGEADFTPGLGRRFLEDAIDRRNFRWLTGCSLVVSGNARPLLACSGCWADEAVFSNQSNFGDGFCEPVERCEPIVLAAEGRLGEGRVVVLNDGTSFTNFAIALPCRLDILRRAIGRLNAEWLDLGWLAALLAGLAGLSAAMGSLGPYSGLRRAVGVTVVAVGMAIGGSLSRAGDDPAPPRRARPTVAFPGEYAHYYLAPTVGFEQRDYRESYDTMFIECLRFGLRPQFLPSLTEAFSVSSALVLPNPSPDLADAFSDGLRRYLEQGKVVIVLASTQLPFSVEGARRILERAMAREAKTSHAVPPPERVVERAGVRVLSWPAVNGLLVVVERAERMSRQGLGHPFPIPSGEQAERFAILDEILGALALHVGIDPAARFTIGRPR